MTSLKGDPPFLSLKDEENVCTEDSGWRCNNNNFFAAEEDEFEFSEPMVSDPVSTLSLNAEVIKLFLRPSKQMYSRIMP